ncbi:MAG TPA: SAM-dependent methyltransferase, partial [Elusimicrobiota bacterium]|nr:SAM-dependent methyltransferase [Elusimicrobiota bacterium]
AREHWTGYLLCRRRRYALSRARFEAAARLDPSRASSAFYAQVARALGEGRAPRRHGAGRRLTIMGLGYRQPFQVSREALFALRDCQVIYSNLSDSSVADFLGLFPSPFRAIVFRRRDRQSTRCARDVMPAFERSRRVAVVTRGHPLYYGRLAYRLVMDCRRLGIEVRVPGSVSISDTLVGMTDHARGETLGLQVRDSAALAALDRRLPLVLYNLSSQGGERMRLSRELASLYPSGQSCVLLAGSGDAEFSPTLTPLAELGAALDRADEAVTLLLPAAAS